MALRRVLAYTAGVVVLVGALASGPVSAASHDAPWSTAGPPTYAAGQLQGVSAVSSTDVWAVGSCHKHTALLKHWDGTSWQHVPGPRPGTTSVLFGVSAVAGDDVWAVGAFEKRGFHTLVQHYDGNAWTTIKDAAASAPDRYLSSVSADAANDVWAVGVDYGNTPAPVVERWDGAAWSGISGIPETVTPHAVLALAPADVWIVGSTENADGSEATATYHWDGTAMTRVPSADPSRLDVLNGVAGMASGSLWAVGTSTGRALAEHWNGTRWQVQRTPGPQQGLVLRATSAAADSDAWAVGNDATTGEPGVLHRTKTGWTSVAGPHGSGAMDLFAVDASAADDAWIVGGQAGSGQQYHPLIEHWDGHQWSRSH